MKIEDYCEENGMYAENACFVLRRLQETDKDNYMKLTLDYSSIAKAYEDESFYELTWEQALKSKDLYLSLFDKHTGTYLGNLMLKNLSDEKQEIGIDIVREHRRKGIGYAAVKLLMSRAKEVSGTDIFEVRIYSDNIPSTKLFKKLGAVKVDCEDSEFISIMKIWEKSEGEEKMSRLREEHKELFARAEARQIIVYEVKVIE